MKKFITGITIGDPAGIGPEVALKALTHSELYSRVIPLLIGSRKVTEMTMNQLGIDWEIREVSLPRQGHGRRGILEIINVENVDIGSPAAGKVQAKCGRASFDYIETAAALAMEGKLDAVVTSPINKESLRAAGVEQTGHTEILSHLTGAANPVTMFEVHNLRVFFLSRHLSLRNAVDSVTEENVYNHIVKCLGALKQLGVSNPVLAVAGLNPHCGEHGLFGDEELRHISPAVRKAREEGMGVTGPVGADSVFHLALKGNYSAVLSLYHDQGHIAAKTYDFERTVSLTLGLPFLRTSPDHGTGFDIAGKAKASETSMLQAVSAAAKYGDSFRKRKKYFS